MQHTTQHCLIEFALYQIVTGPLVYNVPAQLVITVLDEGNKRFGYWRGPLQNDEGVQVSTIREVGVKEDKVDVMRS
jgi:hypothetical protein